MAKATNALLIAGTAGLLLFLLAGKAEAATGPGTGTPKPPGTRPKIPPQSGPGGSKAWTPKDASEVFGDERVDVIDLEGASIYIDPDCNFVIEGALFFPEDPKPWQERKRVGPYWGTGEPDTCPQGPMHIDEIMGSCTFFSAGEEKSIPCFSPPANCTILDLIDAFVFDGVTDPKQIADTIFAQASPLCADVDPGFWGDGLWAWYDDFLGRIMNYLDIAIPDIEEYQASSS